MKNCMVFEDFWRPLYIRFLHICGFGYILRFFGQSCAFIIVQQCVQAEHALHAREKQIIWKIEWFWFRLLWFGKLSLDRSRNPSPTHFCCATSLSNCSKWLISARCLTHSRQRETRVTHPKTTILDRVSHRWHTQTNFIKRAWSQLEDSKKHALSWMC
jgi:hypothetical protein